jgi:hypothetical protein
VLAILAVFLVSGCEHAQLLRPSVLKQLDTDVAALINELPEVDHPNEAIVARLFPHDGLSHAKLDADGVMRDEIRVPLNEYIWKPAIRKSRHPGIDGGGRSSLIYKSPSRFASGGLIVAPGLKGAEETLAFQADSVIGSVAKSAVQEFLVALSA